MESLYGPGSNEARQTPTTVGKAGLSCETAKGGFWIWVDSFGQVTREYNLHPVEAFPENSRKAHSMEAFFHSSVRFKIGSMLTHSPDSAEYKRLWWEIKELVRAQEAK